MIINDDPWLAKEVNADGVHVGKNDASLAIAHEVLGAKAIVGVSCYHDMNWAVQAEKNGADYVAFGACFASRTKAEAKIVDHGIFQKAHAHLSIPIFGIGGITVENCLQIKHAGSDGVAVINALFKADALELTTQNFLKMWND